MYEGLILQQCQLQNSNFQKNAKLMIHRHLWILNNSIILIPTIIEFFFFFSVLLIVNFDFLPKQYVQEAKHQSLTTMIFFWFRGNFTENWNILQSSLLQIEAHIESQTNDTSKNPCSKLQCISLSIKQGNNIVIIIIDYIVRQRWPFTTKTRQFPT